MTKKIAWKPQPKQIEALVRQEQEILYGGARGGGKTDAGLAWLLYDIDKPKYRALVIRRNADDLKDWIDRARRMYANVGGIVVGQPAEIRFKSGAIIRTGHLNDDNAYTKYQGHEYQKILIEELTHISSEDNFEKLLGSCRSTVEGIKPQIFCTTNPDGAGFTWVKKRWRIPDYPSDIVVTKDGTRTRVFIPAKVQDNPVLMEADPQYIEYLNSISDEELRKAWLDGCWTGISVKGAYYVTEIQLMHKRKKITDVYYEPDIPVHTVWDLGVADSTAIGFFQKVNSEIRMIDYHENTGVGLNTYISYLQSLGYVYGSHYAPHDIEARELTSGKSRKEIARELGIDFQVVPKLTIADGINAARLVLHRLFVDKDNCKEFVEKISQYHKEWDDKRGIFKNNPYHDHTSHSADMLRYMAIVEPQFSNNAMDREALVRIEANREANRVNQLI